MSQPLTLLPNVESLATAFLRDQPEAIALVGDRIVTVLGKGQEFPVVRITLFNDVPTVPRPLVHSHFYLQVEAFGGPKALAWRIAETCRALFVARFNGRLSYDIDGHTVEGLVTDCTVTGLRDLPDVEFTPAKPRWLFTLAVAARAPRTS